ncbi:MAG: SpoIIE family protein phosphatase [Spirochaetota bacterium]
MHTLYTLTDESMIGHTRRGLKSLCEQYKFDSIKEKAAVVVIELATNGIKHAKDSMIIVKTIETKKGIEIVYMDKGPGFDVEKSMQDGFSAGGSLGIGLGSIKRLSDECYIYSEKQKATFIVCRFYENNTTSVPPALQMLSKQRFIYSTICVPLIGEEFCGDTVAVHCNDDFALCMIADGLGHGEYAYKASTIAAEVFFDNVTKEPHEILSRIDHALYSTRGASASIAKIIPEKNEVVYAGIGNIAGAIVGEKRVNMVSHNGTLGMHNSTIHTFTYPWSNNALCIMHSDGISSRWMLTDYPNIFAQDLSIIAAVLFNEYHRPKDDSSLLILKENQYNAIPFTNSTNIV